MQNINIKTFEGLWTIDDIKNNRDTLFLYGDNDEHRGKGGQAIIRYESNTMGIPTKKRPTNHPSSFYTDLEYEQNINNIDTALLNIKNELYKYKTLMLPKNGFGTGMAKLKEKAPKTNEYLQGALSKFLEEINK